ncbi:hypothetical protein ACHHYP_05810 [Achlya hypogyna]|uniref:C2H2-type domain-containing protein n=1 Tax=Achlya hypogyna TaxID=1202772 RepID=A0A1V9YWJ4_ACHHY|nr:hypothetical protein ACHHYP_05810 [Achlya hypogyna]
MSCRVLTVGDGDLSYSRALLDTENWADLDVEAVHVHLTASTYDSRASLEDKYGQVAGNIEALEAASQAHITVMVRHDVDATSLSRFKDEPFDRIVFHHPHSGVEDVHRHRRLLSHFFHAALSVLRPNGRIYVTLARDQPKRWEIIKRATVLGLVCCKQELWVEPPGYQRKRHQSDKSFHRILLHGEKVEQQSTLFGFGRKSEGTVPVSVVLAPPLKEPEGGFACEDPSCVGKKFATQQGLKTHLRMVHELGLKKRKREADFSCSQCHGRVFQDAEALQQHVLAKHGKDSRISPDWFGVPAPTDAVETPQQCPVCMEMFPTPSALEAHFATLQPVAVAKWTCETCEKTFEEQRALRQHQNFCNAS